MNRYLSKLISMTAAAVAVSSLDQQNENCRGVQVVIRNTAGGGTSPTLTVTIQGKDPATGEYYTLLASAAIAAGTPATTTLTIYPGITAAANAAISNILPTAWRITTAIGGSDTPTVTAEISAHMIR